MKPKVAIITRTKNRRILLCRAVASIAQQTFENYIHVIVNDGGNPHDVSDALLNLNEHQISKIKIINIDISHGMEAASNIGILSCDSEYIVIHDDDDSWQPTFLQRTVEYLDNNKNTMGVATKSYKILEQVTNRGINIFHAIPYNPEAAYISIFDICRTNTIPNNSFLFRRSILTEVGMYDESFPVVGDWDFNLRFLLKYDIELIEEQLANYHHRLLATGSSRNTITHGIDKHKFYRNKLKNKLLRDSLSSGNIGIGLAINLMPMLAKFNMELIAKELLEKIIIKIRANRICSLLFKNRHAVEIQNRFHSKKL